MEIEEEVMKEFEKLFLELGLKPDEVKLGRHKYVLFYQVVKHRWQEHCRVEIDFDARVPNEIEVIWSGPDRDVDTRSFKLNNPNCFDNAIDYALSILSRWPRWQRSVIPIRKSRKMAAQPILPPGRGA